MYEAWAHSPGLDRVQGQLMAWSNSTGHARTTTTAWRHTRTRILKRDHHRCQTCGAPARQVDHVTSVGQGGTDDDTNLAAICDPCHLTKTAQEALAARQALPSRRRPPEPHPGRL